MKKHGMFLMAIGMMFCMAVSAQDQSSQTDNRPPRQEMRQQQTPQVRAERLAKQLGLTDDEKTKVQALFEKQNADREKMRSEGTNLTREQMRTKMDEMRKGEETEMQKILTPEKFTKYQELRKEQMEKMKQRMQERMGDRPAPQN
jgi:Spy/CpxP family protein refolding chaperone